MVRKELTAREAREKIGFRGQNPRKIDPKLPKSCSWTPTLHFTSVPNEGTKIVNFTLLHFEIFLSKTTSTSLHFKIFFPKSPFFLTSLPTSFPHPPLNQCPQNAPKTTQNTHAKPSAQRSPTKQAILGAQPEQN